MPDQRPFRRSYAIGLSAGQTRNEIAIGVPVSSELIIEYASAFAIARSGQKLAIYLESAEGGLIPIVLFYQGLFEAGERFMGSQMMKVRVNNVLRRIFLERTSGEGDASAGVYLYGYLQNESRAGGKKRVTKKAGAKKGASKR